MVRTIKTAVVTLGALSLVCVCVELVRASSLGSAHAKLWFWIPLAVAPALLATAFDRLSAHLPLWKRAMVVVVGTAVGFLAFYRIYCAHSPPWWSQ